MRLKEGKNGRYDLLTTHKTHIIKSNGEQDNAEKRTIIITIIMDDHGNDIFFLFTRVF